MSNDIHVRVGGSARDDGAAFLAAIRRSERGEDVSQRILSFESWEAFGSILTKGRVNLLTHLHAKEAASIRKLAAALNRPYRRVHDDVVALESAGLIERGADRRIRILVDAVHAEVRFDREVAPADA